MGEADHDTDYLDQSCEANLQGKDRFDRAQNYNHYIKFIFIQLNIIICLPPIFEL